MNPTTYKVIFVVALAILFYAAGAVALIRYRKSETERIFSF